MSTSVVLRTGLKLIWCFKNSIVSDVFNVSTPYFLPHTAFKFSVIDHFPQNFRALKDFQFGLMKIRVVSGINGRQARSCSECPNWCPARFLSGPCWSRRPAG